MKKYIIITLCLIFITCSEPTQTIQQSIESSTTTTLVNEPTIALTDDQIAENFIEYFKQNKISEYLNLTESEIKKTETLHYRAPDYFQLDDLECFIKERGTTWEALLTEYFPVILESDWYFKEFYTVYKEGKEYVFYLNVRYTCKPIGDTSENPDWVGLFGLPFYYEGSWWIFKDIDFEPVPLDTPFHLSFWAERVQIKDFEDIYREWVILAESPDVIFTNCPDEKIKDSTYELQYEIKPNNADLSYLGIFFQKDGDYYTRAFFEKGQTGADFEFPLKGTINPYGLLVDNSEYSGETTYDIDISVGNDYNLYSESTCSITFDN